MNFPPEFTERCQQAKDKARSYIKKAIEKAVDQFVDSVIEMAREYSHDSALLPAETGEMSAMIPDVKTSLNRIDNLECSSKIAAQTDSILDSNMGHQSRYSSPSITSTSHAKRYLFESKGSSRIPVRIFRASPPRDDSPTSSRSSSPDPLYLIVEQFTVRCLYCPDCDKQFCDRKSLNDHLLLKHNIHFYKCPLAKCLNSYNDESALRNHHMAQHRNDPWQCYACSFVGTSSDALSEHLENEHQEGEFECTKSGCGYISRTKSAAIRHFDGNQHSKPDSNGKVVSDDFVGKKAASGNGGGNSRKNFQSLNLENFNWCAPPKTSAPRNKEIYTTVTVMCPRDDCTDFFLGEEELNQHMRDYHNLSPLVCPIVGCPKSFETRNFLEEHARNDHREYHRSWSCPKCGQVAESFSQLFTHVHQYHQEGQYRCMKCDKVTKYRFEISDHYDREHDNDY